MTTGRNAELGKQLTDFVIEPLSDFWLALIETFCVDTCSRSAQTNEQDRKANKMVSKLASSSILFGAVHSYSFHS